MCFTHPQSILLTRLVRRRQEAVGFISIRKPPLCVVRSPIALIPCRFLQAEPVTPEPDNSVTKCSASSLSLLFFFADASSLWGCAVGSISVSFHTDNSTL